MPKCDYCFDNPKGVYTGRSIWGGEWKPCPYCAHRAVSAAVRNADGVSAERMAHRVAGLDVYEPNKYALDDKE